MRRINIYDSPENVQSIILISKKLLYTILIIIFEKEINLERKKERIDVHD